MVAQARPAAPWFPKTRVSAAPGPTSVVNMANSTNPLPKLGTLRLKLNVDVSGVEFIDLDMALGFDTCSGGLGRSLMTGRILMTKRSDRRAPDVNMSILTTLGFMKGDIA